MQKSSLVMAAVLGVLEGPGPYSSFGTQRMPIGRTAPTITKAPAAKKSKRKATQRSQRRNRGK